jgi:hypothetical protein
VQLQIIQSRKKVLRARHPNALQAASEEEDETKVKMLIDAGADINAQGGLYSNAL